jgi:hypothetical protein
MKSIIRVVLSLCFLISFITSSYATNISYTTQDLGSGVWEYSYTITNDTLSIPIEEFTIYFPYGIYDNLISTTSNTDWDILTIQPSNVLSPLAGYYDGLTLSTGILPGTSASGLTVAFNWLGIGTPGSQYFEIVNPSTFDVLESGQTTAVPIPPSLLLLLSGLVGLGVRRFTKR